MNIKQYILSLAVVCCGVSCTEVLDTAPYNQVASGNMWTTESLTDKGVNGVYANLRNWGIYNGGIGGGGVGQWSYESLGPLGQAHETANFLNGSVSPGSGNVNDLWKRLYEGVHRANDAIANIPNSPCSAEKKARLIAECKFLRAFHYFRLNELWRGVPYYDVPVTVEECIKGQETEAFIWSKVLEDLTACINEPNFPNNDFVNGRVSKGAAYALRGKVYMHLKQWGEAIADFDKVDDCGFGLFTGDYKALFTEANERSIEMIFSVQNIELNDYGSVAPKYLGTRSAMGVGGGCWGDHKITPYAVGLYENADGTPFNWENHIPGYTALPHAAREVYFLRDTLDGGGNPIDSRISNSVKARLTALGNAVAANYLPQGNEARIRAAYANRDPRLEKNVVTPYAKYLGVPQNGTTDYIFTYRWPYVANAAPHLTYVIGDFQPNMAEYMVYFQRKFVPEGYKASPITSPRENGGVDDPIIRYADVVLMWAEALVEQGQLGPAQAKVEEVRGRAGIVTDAANFADQTTARNYVRDERRREMLGEGGAYFDELRWGTLKASKYEPYMLDGMMVNGDDVRGKQVWGINERNNSAWRWPDVYSASETNFVWPVPRAEIEKNPNLTPTPGWTY